MRDGMEKSQSIFNRKQFIMVCALAGLLLLGGVLGVSAHSDLQNAEKQFEDTISYVKEQCTGYDNLNLATEAKSLMRVFGGVPEWPKGTDCKSVVVRLRWFKSTPLHHHFSVAKYWTVGGWFE